VVETNTPDSPFLVDSTSEAIQAAGLGIGLVLHPIVGVERSDEGRIRRIAGATDIATRESVMHFEVDRRLTPDEAAALTETVRTVLAQVAAVVTAYGAMRGRMRVMQEAVGEAATPTGAGDAEEAAAFVDWLLDENIVLLGCAEVERSGDATRIVAGTELGLVGASPAAAAALAEAPVAYPNGDLVAVARSNHASTVHRRERMEVVAVAVPGTSREHRAVFLFTAKAYLERATRIPLLRRKVARIMAEEDLVAGSHDYKAAISILESFPLHELFAAPTEELRRNIAGLLALQEQERVKLVERFDYRAGRVSLLVAMPRDRFSAALRQELQDLFVQRFDGAGVDYHLSLGDADQALVHFTIQTASGHIPEVSFRELEREVVALTRTWEDQLRDELVAVHGDADGAALAARWGPLFPDYYRSATGPTVAAVDVSRFELLRTTAAPFVIGLRNEDGGGTEGLTRVCLYKSGGKASLSDVMSILEALGFGVVEEVPTRLLDGDTYLHDFGVVAPGDGRLDLDAAGERVGAAIEAVLAGRTESDSLNRLVVLAGLDWRQVAVMRALRTYRRRVGAQFTVEYVNDAFAANPDVAAKLLRYFELRLGPDVAGEDAEQALRAEIVADLEAVQSLDQDRILRTYLGLIEAVVRTSAYLPDRDSIAFKLHSADVPGMPRPTPLYEIYVHSPVMEGIHLRAGRVARGGIRWSDRMEDYRTEVLGLMKAQTTKNAVIVPTGSKGGFVLRRPPGDPAALREEVRRQYSTYIRGLLDVTDDLRDGAVVHPEGVRVRDGDDPYLVVAADKGTAALSDTANAIATEAGFWLGDAFASGGSSGYDHKKLGITARGAWESVKRHFRELGVDVATQPFTAVGIGDMSGDVFGNGMLLSDQLRLVAAFDHRHVFLDPDPDPAAAFAERTRLFALPSSSWDDYDRAAISPGGGVWARSAKKVELSQQARRALGVEAEELTPAEVIQAILRAPVDLLWNGGIGTYVKASTETGADAGDRANDAVRIDGCEVRARVVAEGGNLGFTQRGRIEYARGGGRINTDYIDNAGGVNTSDHEVNLKILLGLAERRGELTRTERDSLLAEVADDVVAHVLYDNYLQAQILSQAVTRSVSRIDAYEDLMLELESDGLLDRALEYLPSSEEMVERGRSGAGMTRPELCVLVAYAKLDLKRKLLESDLLDDPSLERDVCRYFPRKVVERFGHLVLDHPLRRELTATVLANDVVNSEGITFASRTARESGADVADVVRAYLIARAVTGAGERWSAIEALDGKIDPALQEELMDGVDLLVEKVSRWYLANAPGADVGNAIAADEGPFAELAARADSIGFTSEREEAVRELAALGVPGDVARRHATQPDLVFAPDAAAVSRATGVPVEQVAYTMLALGAALHLDELEAALAGGPAASLWERWALGALEGDLLRIRRDAAERALAVHPGDVDAAIRAFLAATEAARVRLDRLVERLDEAEDPIAALTVAVRQARAAVPS
jgi:glutamate dehydrogenase